MNRMNLVLIGAFVATAIIVATESPLPLVMVVWFVWFRHKKGPAD
ncbi:MAG: hypothetical protein AAFY54_01940 [Cyanobacteria bacterium J06648_10]